MMVQDTVRKHSYFTTLKVHVDLEFRVVVADMQLRDAKKVVVGVFCLFSVGFVGFLLFLCLVFFFFDKLIF